MRDGVNICAGCEYPFGLISADEHKTCPTCAEEVKQAATKCRFCGHEYQPVQPAMAFARVAEIKAKIDRGELLTPDEALRVSEEELRAGQARLQAHLQLEAAEEAEAQRLGRPTTTEEQAKLRAGDRCLAQAKVIMEFNNQRCALLFPLSLKNSKLNLTHLAVNHGAALAAVARSEERSHAGLFAVSPFAWAIKKTWNGSPRRR